MEIAGGGSNVYVKIPLMNTRWESAAGLVGKMSGTGVKINVTAMIALDQVCAITNVLDSNTAAYISVFAGRVADPGRNAMPIMASGVKIMAPKPRS